MLREFSQKQHIPYPLLSDLESDVIRDYGIINSLLDAMLYGIPFPGVFVTDADGIVVAKFFHDSYKKRDSPELLIDAALGRISLERDEPHADGGDAEVHITASVHGAKKSAAPAALHRQDSQTRIRRQQTPARGVMTTVFGTPRSENHGSGLARRAGGIEAPQSAT